MKKNLFWGVLALLTLFTACQPDEPENKTENPKEEIITFEPYFLPLPDFVYEGSFDTLWYNERTERRVGPLYVFPKKIYDTGATNPYVQVMLRFEEEFVYVKPDNENEMIQYIFMCNMPLDDNENFMPGVYKTSLEEYNLYAITLGGIIHYVEDANEPGRFRYDREDALSNACFMIEKKDELYTVQFWLEFVNGNRHYIVYRDCKIPVNIYIAPTD